MALPAFLIPALTGFAISKLTGASTKKALQSALLGAAVGGITQGFTADAAAKQLSTDAITKQAMVSILKESKMNSLTNRGLFIAPVTISATANIVIIRKAANPITAFSLIELLSLNRSLKNFFMLIDYDIL